MVWSITEACSRTWSCRRHVGSENWRWHLSRVQRIQHKWQNEGQTLWPYVGLEGGMWARGTEGRRGRGGGWEAE